MLRRGWAEEQDRVGVQWKLYDTGICILLTDGEILRWDAGAGRGVDGAAAY